MLCWSWGSLPGEMVNKASNLFYLNLQSILDRVPEEEKREAGKGIQETPGRLES